MYETMVWWEAGDHAAVYRDSPEIWGAAEKVVLLPATSRGFQRETE